MADRASDLPYGHGSKLWKYWTAGEGFAKWSAAVHKWTTLRDLLLKAGVPPASVDGLTTNIIMAVMPGYMKLAHKKGRSAMTHTDDADRAGAKAPYGDVPYADPGYLDADGNQAGKSGKPGVKRYPLSADKVMAAWTYISQKANAGQYTPEQLQSIKGKIKAAMAKHGHMVADTDGDTNAAHFAPALDVVRSGGGMELQPAEDGSLGTLTGRFSEFGRWYRVSSKLEGDFMERVAPGATVDTIRDNKDSMRVLFDHGMDAQIGNKVLGPIDVLEEKSDGPHYEVPLFDTSYNRDLLPGLKAGVYGASMRMRVTGDEWDDHPARSDSNPDGIPERTITQMKVPEFGPVTFPANPGATSGVRSGTDEFYHRLRQVNAPAFEDAVRAAGLSPEDFTGRDSARSAPGGDEQDDVQPGKGETSPSTLKAAQRDRAWLMRRQPYA
jgi:HK97 family phage prohead protease